MKINLIKVVLPALIFVAVTCLISSCGTNKDKPTIITPANLKKGEISLSDIAEDIVYIKLNDSILLSKINDVKKSEIGYYIKTSEGLFYFDNNGMFKLQIGKKGKGPGEYSFVDDFEVDDKTQQIFILNKKQVKIYNFSGEFIHSFETPDDQWFREIEIFENMIFFPKGFGLSELTNEWYITDFEGNIKAQKANGIKDIELRVDYKANLCFEAGGKLFYWNQLNDTVFQINETLKVAYLFARDKFRITKNDLSSDENYRKKNSWQLISILGTERYVFFEYLLIKDMKRIFTVLDNKKKAFYELNQTNLGIEPEILNSFDNGPCFMPKSKISYKGEEWFVNWIDAFQLQRIPTFNAFKNSTPKYPEKKKELERLANSLDENDNPVLMLVRLKE